MKPFLGVDLTTDKKNEQVNGNEFLVAKPSNTLVQSFERSGLPFPPTGHRLRWWRCDCCCGNNKIIIKK